MVTLFELAILSLSWARIVTTYTCSCYCYSSYVGSAYSSACSSSACQYACYNSYSYNYCYSLSYTYGTCITSTTDSYLASYNSAVSVGAIIGIVIGALAGLAMLVVIIVVIVIICKRRPVRVLAMRPNPQQTGQISVVQGPGQQWVPNYYHPTMVGSMNQMNTNFPPAYMPTQPSNMQY